MAELAELRAKRAEAVDQWNALLFDEQGKVKDVSEAVESQCNRLEKQVNDLDSEIKRMEASQAAKAAEAKPVHSTGATSEDRKHFKAMLAGKTKDMSVGSNPDGGFAVPESLQSTVINQLQKAAPLASLVRQGEAQSGDISQLINTRGTASGWVGETDTRAETGTPTMKEVKPEGGELYAYPVVSNWALNDVFFDVDGFLRENVGDEMGQALEAAVTSGDGVDKPDGFLQNTRTTDTFDADPLLSSVTKVLSGAASSIGSGGTSGTAVDNLVSVMHSLRARYRQDESTAWAVSNEGLEAIRKLKDADGRPLYQPAITDGQPDRLLGFPVVLSEFMPSVATGNAPIAFGAWRRFYGLWRVGPMRVIRDEVTTPGKTKFYFSQRYYGGVLDGRAVALLEIGS